MGLLSLLFKNPVAFIMLVIPLLYSVVLHEMAHGWVAYLFGDDTAKRYGRFSLNPLKHLDPAGTLALFIIGFGWAKPVPVNYNNLKDLRLGLISVSLAGCITNILIATIALFLLQFQYFHGNYFYSTLLLVVARVNTILGALNLIPIPPLDGSKVLMGFLPSNAQRSFMKIEPYGFLILIVLLFTGLLDPVITLMQKLILGSILIILRLGR